MHTKIYTTRLTKMAKRLSLVFIFSFSFLFLHSQTLPYGIVSSSNQNVRSSPNGSVMTTVKAGNKLFAVSKTSDGWYLFSKAATTSSNNMGYVAGGTNLMNPSTSTKYVKVQNTGSTGLRIRTNAGTSYGTVTISGSNAKGWDGQYFASTGNIVQDGDWLWFEIYLTDDCSQTKGWMGNGGSSNNYISTNAAVTIKYNVTTSATPSNGGTTSGDGSYSENSTVTVSAKENNGFSFTRWEENGNSVSTSKSYSFTIKASRTLKAVFQQVNSYSVGITANPSQGGTPSGGGNYSAGANVTVKANPNTGYTFSGWYENAVQVSSQSSYSFTINSNRNLEARYVQQIPNYTISITASPPQGGNPSGNGTYQSGTTVTLKANVNSGYNFTGWFENATKISSESSYSFTINGDRNIEARYQAQVASYNVNITASPSQGGNPTGSGSYQSGSTVTIKANANPGFNFTGWYEGNNKLSTLSSYSFTISNDRNFEARYEQQVISNSVNLSISKISANNTSIVAGGGITINYDLVSSGNSPAGASITAFHLYTSPSYSTNAKWLAEDDCPVIGSSSTLSRSKTMIIPTGTAPGIYYIIASADAMNVISESNENDNRNTVAISIVTVLPQTDTYPWRNSSNSYCMNNQCEADAYSFCKHWCTSYVAWKVNEFYGVTSTSLAPTDYPFNNFMTGGTQRPDCNSQGNQYKLSDACHWAVALAGLGITVNNTPAVGSIAQWNQNEPGVGASGHVAFVDAVLPDGVIQISEYNWDKCKYGTRTIHMNDPNVPGNRKPGRFIHVEAGGLGGGNVITGINNITNDEDKVKIFPNPSNGNLTMNIHVNNSEQASMFVISSNGQIIRNEAIMLTKGDNVVQKNYSDLAEGIYILSLNLKEKKLVTKFIISR